MYLALCWFLPTIYATNIHQFMSSPLTAHYTHTHQQVPHTPSATYTQTPAQMEQISSSDDSDNSECQDHALNTITQPQRARQRQRQIWIPNRTPSTPQKRTDERVRRNIREREDYASGAYIGDAGHSAYNPLQIRIASTNINKNAYSKCSEEITHWMTANHIDFLILADADLPPKSITHFWTKQQLDHHALDTPP